jgi:myo-inositol-1(or 4)-monophosphatase
MSTMLPPVPVPEPNLDSLLELAVTCAEAAGRELIRRYGHVAGLETKSSATDPVSDADRASEALLVRMLTDARPDDGLLGEEGASRAGRSGLTWVVDPLDGTVNYLYQLGNFAVSVAAQDANGSVVGVVHDPLDGRSFTAVRGRGAFLGERRLAVNDPVPLDRALLGTGFGYSPARRALQAAIVGKVLPQVRDIRRFGSAALDLCLVAAGQLDAFYEEGVQAWDVAAGGLVAQEAGAVMTALTLTDATTGWVVAGPGLHPQLVAALSG